MAGESSGMELPSEAQALVSQELDLLAARLGPCAIEWGIDATERVWIFQLHSSSEGNLPSAHPEVLRWRTFDPSAGLDVLRSILRDSPPDEGIEVLTLVGLTSHVGEILRKSGRAWRFAPD